MRSMRVEFMEVRNPSEDEWFQIMFQEVELDEDGEERPVRPPFSTNLSSLKHSEIAAGFWCLFKVIRLTESQVDPQRFCPVDQVITRNWAPFRSKEFRRACRELGVRHIIE